jgi:hypothetical protein
VIEATAGSGKGAGGLPGHARGMYHTVQLTSLLIRPLVVAVVTAPAVFTVIVIF